MENGFNNNEGDILTIVIGQNEEGETTVSGSIVQQDAAYFSNVLYKGDIFAAVAAASAVIRTTGDYCMMSLSEDADGALTTVGSVTVEMSNCGFAVNSNSDEAVSFSGNVDVTVGDATVVGDIEITGGAADFTATSTTTGSAPIPDPYADFEPPEDVDDDDCDFNNYSANGDAELWPGVYCGGISLGGNGDVFMNPGVYYLYAGDFDISGNGELVAENVSIVLTGSDDDGWSDLDVTGGKDMTFTAPLEGEDMAGLAFFQDRAAPDDGSCSRLLGNSTLDLWGAAYFPNKCLEIGGNANNSAFEGETCSRLIANTINIHGNPNLGNNCDGVATEDTGRQLVRLIE